jgi:hypothetical protein
MYEPKKKKYNSLKQLYNEMIENGVKVKSFDGITIISKKQKYTLLDGIITVKGQ